jgi:predicted ABC-type transport system involved in lysophospholipase L1 biosynthesis ATPase subunit
MLVTHDLSVAAQAKRQITFQDGKVLSDTHPGTSA